jgi:hypothetical protein
MSPDFGEVRPAALPEDNRNQIAVAQARRDRARLAASQAEIEALRLHLAALENSLGYRTKARLVRGLRLGLRKANALNRRLRRTADLATASSTLAAPEATGRGRLDRYCHDGA